MRPLRVFTAAASVLFPRKIVQNASNGINGRIPAGPLERGRSETPSDPMANEEAFQSPYDVGLPGLPQDEGNTYEWLDSYDPVTQKDDGGKARGRH